MLKKVYRNIMALTLVFSITLINLTYADTVVIGAAPGTNDGRSMSANTNTAYLQNQYTGPGIIPNSSMTGLTPIQGVTYQQSAGQNPIAYGANDNSPTTTTIYSPSVKTNGNVTGNTSTNVVSNYSIYNSRVSGESTSDSGPTVKETHVSPSKESSTGITNTNTPSATTNKTTTNVPEATTTTQQTVSTDVIVYTSNDNIQAAKPSIDGSAAIVVNATTRQIYYSKGGFTTYHPASLANLVTASILIANRALEDELTVSATAVANLESGATTAGLKAGDKIKVRDAIAAMFVGSCCDVANVVAENIAGSVAAFVNIMNQTVKSWGCVATNFTNPTGLNSDAQVTTTYDMAIIMDKATANPALKVLLQQDKYVLPATATRAAKTLTSRNKILTKGDSNYYDGISASRLGYTSKALYTIASELDYNGQRIIAVVLKTKKAQWTDTKKLLNYAKIASLEPAAQNAQTYNTTFNTFTDPNQKLPAQTIEAPATATNQLPVAGTQNNNQTSAQNTNQATTQNGDTSGAWAKDNTGWYFMKSNGQKAVNEWIRQGSKLYCVDSTGYMITGWRQMSNGNTYYFDPTTGELRYNTWVNVSTGSYYLQGDGALAKASSGQTMNITTSVGVYTIDDTGKAIAKVS